MTTTYLVSWDKTTPASQVELVGGGQRLRAAFYWRPALGAWYIDVEGVARGVRLVAEYPILADRLAFPGFLYTDRAPSALGEGFDLFWASPT